MNLANKLTLARIFLVPVFMIILVSKVPYGKWIAFAVFLLAASTDGLDGYIARSRKQITRLGKFLDPLADKLLISAALVSLVELREIPAWVAIIIIGREFAINGLRAIVATEGVVVSASILGKLKTIAQIVAISAYLINFPLASFLMTIAVILTVWSGMDYYLKLRPWLKNK